MLVACVAQSNDAATGLESTVDSDSTTRVTDTVDEESNASRRQKNCKQRAYVPASSSANIPPAPRKPTNPYSFYCMLRKKV